MIRRSFHVGLRSPPRFLLSNTPNLERFRAPAARRFRCARKRGSQHPAHDLSLGTLAHAVRRLRWPRRLGGRAIPRGDCAPCGGAAELLALTNTLARDSTEFASLWQARQLDVLQLKAKRLRHAELGIVDLTYAPLRPRGVADDLSVVV